MTIRERVISLTETHNISQKVLASAINAPTSTVNGWFKYENRNPSSEYLIPICELFSVSVEWLLTGTDSNKTAVTDREAVLLNAFRGVDETGKANITYACMNELHRVEKKQDTTATA